MGTVSRAWIDVFAIAKTAPNLWRPVAVWPHNKTAASANIIDVAHQLLNHEAVNRVIENDAGDHPHRKNNIANRDSRYQRHF